MKNIKSLKYIGLSFLLASVLGFSACGGDSDDSSGSALTKISLTNGKVVNFSFANAKENVSDNSWDFSYETKARGSSFWTNGGQVGTKGVSVCLAKTYPKLYDANHKGVLSEFKKLTADNTLSDFTAVTKSDCKAGKYIDDNLATAINTNDWLKVTPVPRSAPTFSLKTGKEWLIRYGDATSYKYAKIKVSSVDMTPTIGKAKIKLAISKYAGSSFGTYVDSPELSFLSPIKQVPAYYDIATNTVASASQPWDILVKISGHNTYIQVNGFASGGGTVGIADASGVTKPSKATYKQDTPSGALSKPGYYGPFDYSGFMDNEKTHNLLSTFTVYIFKVGTDYYKVQFTGIIGVNPTSGTGGVLAFRYARL